MLRIVVTSVLVDDQDKALAFYRDLLGFEVKHDIPMGAHRWLTLTAPGDGDGVELLLKPTRTPRPSPGRRRWWRTGSPIHPSAWTTCKVNMNGWRRPA